MTGKETVKDRIERNLEKAKAPNALTEASRPTTLQDLPPGGRGKPAQPKGEN